MENTEAKDGKWLYAPPDLKDFLMLMKPLQIRMLFILLDAYMNDKAMPKGKDVDTEVLMTFLHILSFHKNKKQYENGKDDTAING